MGGPDRLWRRLCCGSRHLRANRFRCGRERRARHFYLICVRFFCYGALCSVLHRVRGTTSGAFSHTMTVFVAVRSARRCAFSRMCSPRSRKCHCSALFRALTSVKVAGSAYIYAYISVGEIWAFVVGWAMMVSVCLRTEHAVQPRRWRVGLVL